MPIGKPQYLKRFQPLEPPNPSLRATSHIAICDAGGNSDVVYYAAERNPYGTREDKKVGGDASSSACGFHLRQGYGGRVGGQGSCRAKVATACHLFLGSPDCEDGRGYVSMMEYEN